MIKNMYGFYFYDDIEEMIKHRRDSLCIINLHLQCILEMWDYNDLTSHSSIKRIYKDIEYYVNGCYWEYNCGKYEPGFRRNVCELYENPYIPQDDNLWFIKSYLMSIKRRLNSRGTTSTVMPRRYRYANRIKDRIWS